MLQNHFEFYGFHFYRLSVCVVKLSHICVYTNRQCIIHLLITAFSDLHTNISNFTTILENKIALQICSGTEE